MDFEKYDRLISGDFAEKFDKLFDLLLEHNKMYNLTSITDRDGVYMKHFLDSLAGEKFIKNGANVVEIGSGGGFPSLPLKIVRGDLSFNLIESTGKKCSYLDNCVDKLALDNVTVKNIRAEDGGKDKALREKFDVCIARAVARLNTLCEYCLPFVKLGGRFIAYKGDAQEEIEEAASAINILGGEIEEVEKYQLPNGDKRALIVIKKVGGTPLKYPRGQGKERKNPL